MGDDMNLLSLLAAAESNLAGQPPEPSEWTADSEERDQLLLTQQMEDDLERKSQSSLSARHGVGRRVRRAARRGQGDRRTSRAGASDSLSCSSGSLNSHQLQQLQWQLGKSSASVGSGSADTPATEEVWKLLQMTSQNMLTLRQAEASAASKHRQDMARLQSQLDQVRDTELRAQKEKVDANADLKKAEVAQNVEINIIRQKLHSTQGDRGHTQVDLEVKGNFLLEIETEAQQQIETVQESIEAKRAEQKKNDEEMRAMNYESKAKMKNDIAETCAELEKCRKELQVASDERDVLQRLIANRYGIVRKAENLQQVLDIANKELERVTSAAHSGPRARKEAVPDFDRVRFLMNQTESNQEQIDREIQALRDQWYREKQVLEEHGVEAGSIVGTRCSSSGASSSASGGRNLLGRPAARQDRETIGRKATFSKLAWTGKLGSIAEEEDADLVSGDGSVAPAHGDDEGSDAPEGERGVADFADFDVAQAMATATPAAQTAAVKIKEKFLKEKIERLQRKKEETLALKQELKEEMAAREAELNSKIDEMRAWLDNVRHVAIEKEEAAVELKQIVAKEDVNIAKVTDKVKVEIEVVEKRKVIKDQHIQQLFDEVTRREWQSAEDKALWDDLVKELEQLNEATKHAEEEAEERKTHMENSRVEQEQVASELQQQLARMRRDRFPTLDSCDDEEELTPIGELEHMQNELATLTEGRNVLLNTLEWKDVQWRSVIEDMEQQIMSERMALRAMHVVELRELQQQLREEAEQFKRSLLGK